MAPCTFFLFILFLNSGGTSLKQLVVYFWIIYLVTFKNSFFWWKNLKPNKCIWGGKNSFNQKPKGVFWKWGQMFWSLLNYVHCPWILQAKQSGLAIFNRILICFLIILVCTNLKIVFWNTKLCKWIRFFQASKYVLYITLWLINIFFKRLFLSSNWSMKP